MKPNRAGSPTDGSTLINGTANGITLVRPPAGPGDALLFPKFKRMYTRATPTTVCDEHSSLRKDASGHCANGVGLPINPGGSLKCRSFASAIGCPSAFSLSISVVVNWNGCEPACVSTPPPSFSGLTSYVLTPNDCGVSPIVSGCLMI